MKYASLKSVTAAVFGMGLATSAQAIDTLVQLNTDGIAGFDVTGINEFDWQSSGDLAIVDALPGGGSIADGVLRTSFLDWASNAVVGDTVDFGINAQARLNDILDNGGNSLTSGLGLDTGSGGLFEITAALTGTESATVVAPGTLLFTSITGSYEFFIDDTPDVDVNTGVGFTDGTSFLQGLLGPVGATNGSFIFGTGGSSLLRNTVTSYDSSIIETDPATFAPLIGTTFDTLVTFASLGEANINVGGTIGLDGYTVNELDLTFKADANTEFEGTEVPAPASLLLLGAGLLGLGFTRRKARV